MELIESQNRWNDFLKNIKTKAEALYASSDELCLKLLELNELDPNAMVNAWNAFEQNIAGLRTKVDDVFEEKVAPSLESEGWSMASIQAYWDSSGAQLNDWMEYETIRKGAEIYYKAANLILKKKKKILNTESKCTQCSAALPVQDNIFRSCYIECDFCQKVNTFEPGSQVRNVEYFCLHHIAHYHHLEKEIIYLRLNNQMRENNFEDINLMHKTENALYEFSTDYLKERNKIIPALQSDFKRDLKAKMDSFYIDVESSIYWDHQKIDELRTVIAWQDPDPEVLFYKWTDNSNEIKKASQIIINPGQGLVFVYEGKIKEVYEEEGSVDLTSENIPFWRNISKVLQTDEFEQKVGLYFYRKSEISNLKWGTPSPIKYMDPVYSFPVGLRAFGVFSLKVTRPQEFFTNIVAGREIYEATDLQALLLARITPSITDFLAKGKISYIDIDANRKEISEKTMQDIRPVFQNLGFEMTDYQINGTNFDDETNTRISRISDVVAEATAAKVAGIDYASLQKLSAMTEVAASTDSAGKVAMGVATGVDLSHIMTGVAAPSIQQAQAIPDTDIKSKLAKLKDLFESELISDKEYEDKKLALLEQL